MIIPVTPADQEAARLHTSISLRLGKEPDPRMRAIADAEPLDDDTQSRGRPLAEPRAIRRSRAPSLGEARHTSALPTTGKAYRRGNAIRNRAMRGKPASSD